MERRNRTGHLVSSGFNGHGDHDAGVFTHGVAPIVTRRRDLIANDLLV